MKVPEKQASESASDARAFPAIAGHVIVGLALGLVLALLDTLRAGLRDLAPRVALGEVATAGLHLLALYAMVGVAAGAFAGVLARVMLANRSLHAALAPILRASRWRAPAPRFVAEAIAALALLATLVAGVAGLHVLFTERFHRPDLAGWTLGAVTAGLVLVLALVRPLVVAPLTALAKRAGAAATPLALLVFVAVVAAIAITALFTRFPALLVAYDPVSLAWAPIALALWAALALAMAPAITRMERGAPTTLAIALALTAAIATIVSGLTYGESNRVRTVVEQRSVVGRRFLVLLTRLTDQDGDGHSWAWGGGDCDDSDPHVHPGSLDPAGDGIDQDCFAGDGAPIVVERGLGAFGTRPDHLVRPNFLVISVDALHRDHLGVNGYERPVSPRMDAFIEGAVQMTEVVPQASRSLRSIPSMWNGQYPSETAFGPEYLWPELLEENVMAPELLREAGYATSVVMGTDYFRRVEGFFQGFDHVDQLEIYDPPRSMAVDHALPELDRLVSQGQPWLLWVHLFNVHAPYLQDGVPSRFGDEVVDQYDTEITYADREVGRLLDALTERGLDARTVVVLASDHGEAFQEHGQWGHASTLYEEELASVLAMRVPGLRPGRVEAPVALLDLAPTILNLADVTPSEPMSGISLVPFLTRERAPDPERPIFAELLPDGMFPSDIKSIRRGHRKAIWFASEGTLQYFDLEADPGELNDLSDSRPEEAQALLFDLRAWIATAAMAENRSDTFVQDHILPGPPPALTHRTEIHYPGFTVLGFDFPEDHFHPGDHIPLTFYYRVDGSIDADLFFMVKIDGPLGYRVPPHFHAWHYPLSSRYRTPEWRPGQYIQDPTPIVIPPDIRVPVELTISLAIRDETGVYLLGERDGVRLYDFELESFRVDAEAPGVGTPP